MLRRSAIALPQHTPTALTPKIASMEQDARGPHKIYYIHTEHVVRALLRKSITIHQYSSSSPCHTRNPYHFLSSTPPSNPLLLAAAVGVSFGTLFDDEEGQQFFEAIVGTLRAAKKRGVVDFKGQVRMLEVTSVSSTTSSVVTGPPNTLLLPLPGTCLPHPPFVEHMTALEKVPQKC